MTLEWFVYLLLAYLFGFLMGACITAVMRGNDERP